ncbi:MAG: GNAT family N-acetyltransferase, partial [Streptomycetaceae bacterium]|nr:GNAT family N-acetyltransferase [Streptomycetaceae bacterium]
MPDDLVLRPLADADELALFTTLPYTLNHELADDLAAGRRRPEWMWVALAGGRVRA